MQKYILKLFVTGRTPSSETAIRNLKRLCQTELQGRYELHVIDVLASPQLAEDEHILVTPTLIKSLPPPISRLIGDLSDTEKVLQGLRIMPQPGIDEEENAQNE